MIKNRISMCNTVYWRVTPSYIPPFRRYIDVTPCYTKTGVGAYPFRVKEGLSNLEIFAIYIISIYTNNRGTNSDLMGQGFRVSMEGVL